MKKQYEIRTGGGSDNNGYAPWMVIATLSGDETEGLLESYFYRGYSISVYADNGYYYIDIIVGNTEMEYDYMEMIEIARIVFADYEDISLFPETGPLIPNCA